MWWSVSRCGDGDVGLVSGGDGAGWRQEGGVDVEFAMCRKVRFARGRSGDLTELSKHNRLFLRNCKKMNIPDNAFPRTSCKFEIDNFSVNGSI